MTILIDTNVVLDILLHRQPWYDNAAMIAGLSQQYTIAAFVTASTVTDIFYIV
ncbi:MAG: PIN domain-containing protein [Treponema sp.]|jgi:predicted nucleic acid-binding protein|nr:PIN domain-containing protein [Treponema sp.]